MSPAGTALANGGMPAEMEMKAPTGGMPAEMEMKAPTGGRSIEPFIATKITVIDPSPPPPTPRQRKFLPGVADLVDRLTISLQKQIFVQGQAEHYAAEVADIIHDIDLVIADQGHAVTADALRWALVVMLANRFIWENESKIRDGSSTLPPEELARRLQATHMINGVRNSAKNKLASLMGGRLDYKIDCFAADDAWMSDFGNWNIFTT